MSYDLDHQVALASRMQSTGRRFRLPDFAAWTSTIQKASHGALPYLPYVTGFACAAAGAVVCGPWMVGWWLRRARVRRMVKGHGAKSDATILYEQMLESLAKRGVQKPAWLTPVEFARSLPPSASFRLVDGCDGRL